MILIFLLIISFFSFLLTWIFLRIFIPNASKKLISIPDLRTSHDNPTPQGGGIPFIFIGFAIALLNPNYKFLLICIPIGIIGLLDDFFKINPLIRYIFQVSTAIYLVSTGGINYENLINKEGAIVYLILSFLMIFCTSIINFINFMDGLDGLVTLNLIIFFLVVSIDAHIYFLPLITTLFGFLIWNWSPAKVFMGDVGSTFLGAVVVGVILQKENLSDSFFLMLVLTPLLVDPFICVIRRFFAGQNIFRPHKLHLYQRLHQAGWTHSKVAIVYAIGTLILGILFLFKSYKLLIIATFIEILFGIYLDKKNAISFNNLIRN